MSSCQGAAWARVPLSCLLGNYAARWPIMRHLCRDIKPSNLFLQAGKTVIGDFGLGRHLAPASLARTQVGTPLYFSPEVCQEKPYGLPSDVWAFGCEFDHSVSHM